MSILCLKSLGFQHNMQHLYQSNTIKNGCSTYGYEEITFHLSISATELRVHRLGRKLVKISRVWLLKNSLKPEMNDVVVILQAAAIFRAQQNNTILKRRQT